MKTHKPQVCPVCLGSVLDACRSVYCSAKCRKRSRRLAYRANRLARGLSGMARPPRADHDDPDCRGTTRCWCWHKARWGELFDERKDKGAVLPSVPGQVLHREVREGVLLGGVPQVS